MPVTAMEVLDGAGGVQYVSMWGAGTVPSPFWPAQDFYSINGVNPVAVGNGVTNTGTQRVTLSSDGTGIVNAVQSGTWNLGTVTTVTTVAAVTAITNPLPAGTNSIGGVTANAGTNLNTSLLALEGGNLATLASAIVAALMQINISKVAGGTAMNAGQTGTLAIGGAIATNNNLSAACDPVPVSGSDYGGTPKIQIPKVDSNGTLYVDISHGTATVTGTVAISGTVPVSGTVSITANSSVNVNQIAGTATSVNNGAVDAGTQRVTLANNSTGQVTANAGTNLNTSALALETGGNLATLAGAVSGAKSQVNVAQVAGTAAATGNGATTAGTQRITIANDSTGIINAVQSGTWNIGTVTTVSAVTAISNALPAGANHLGEVGTPAVVIGVNPTISTSVYVANYVVGSIQTLTGAAQASGRPVTLTSICVTDNSDQKAALQIFFFDAALTGSYTDHAAFSWGAGDLALCLGCVQIATTDYVDQDSKAVATKFGIGLKLKPSSGTTLYAVAVTTGTPTYAALALTFNYGFEQN